MYLQQATNGSLVAMRVGGQVCARAKAAPAFPRTGSVCRVQPFSTNQCRIRVAPALHCRTRRLCSLRIAAGDYSGGAGVDAAKDVEGELASGSDDGEYAEGDEEGLEEMYEDLPLINSTAVGFILQYAIALCNAAGTYEVHSWMLLLGMLRRENCTASIILKELGLHDLYGAWHEVLWALHVADGLKPQAYRPQVVFSERVRNILCGAANAATLQGREKVESQDLLLLLSGTGVLDGLFPDLDLSAERVRKEIESLAGVPYVIPGEEFEDEDEAATEDLLVP